MLLLAGCRHMFWKCPQTLNPKPRLRVGHFVASLPEHTQGWRLRAERLPSFNTFGSARDDPKQRKS